MSQESPQAVSDDEDQPDQDSPDATNEANAEHEATAPHEPGHGSSEGGAPETGDLVIDAALRDLADAPVDDLDAQIERGEQVQRTLQGRLSDLGG